MKDTPRYRPSLAFLGRIMEWLGLLIALPGIWLTLLALLVLTSNGTLDFAQTAYSVAPLLAGLLVFVGGRRLNWRNTRPVPLVTGRRRLMTYAGEGLVGLGILIATASGSCTLIGLVSVSAQPQPFGRYSYDWLDVLAMGGIPFALGIIIIMGGRALRRKALFGGGQSTPPPSGTAVP